MAAESRAADRALLMVREQVDHAAPPIVKRNVTQADTIRVDPGRVYRSCIPTNGPTARGAWSPTSTRRRRAWSSPGREPNVMWGAAR